MSTTASPQNLSALAYSALSLMIRGHKLKGGEAILEARLAESLNISRTPLREALQRLEGEGLVIKNGSRSYMVRGVDLAEYLHSLKVREILEPEAAALAIPRIDPAAIAAVRAEIAALGDAAVPYDREAHWRVDARLHELFIDACGNPVLTQMIRGLRATTHLFEIARLRDRLQPDNLEHIAILDALAAGDARAARKAAQQHLRSLHAFALTVVS
ncbi:GntR family transcriptional regulator [Roseomonas haemaphysalidis]|uniref:GntR family transcriptional regulator n=1 Tax=Roseomonas haemaphysalidis TaxID=2768162 RepID=A0ABS3KUT4_9PROT|nr:GntR family transcriptional regulator [Roseomonas haemaphysalidis]MBO1080091.1 GntR family transcriptional regulator [Roseomonas haemaphysalidis]